MRDPNAPDATEETDWDSLYAKERQMREGGSQAFKDKVRAEQAKEQAEAAATAPSLGTPNRRENQVDEHPLAKRPHEEFEETLLPFVETFELGWNPADGFEVTDCGVVLDELDAMIRDTFEGPLRTFRDSSRAKSLGEMLRAPYRGQNNRPSMPRAVETELDRLDDGWRGRYQEAKAALEEIDEGQRRSFGVWVRVWADHCRETGNGPTEAGPPA